MFPYVFALFGEIFLELLTQKKTTNNLNLHLKNKKLEFSNIFAV